MATNADKAYTALLNFASSEIERFNTEAEKYPNAKLIKLCPQTIQEQARWIACYTQAAIQQESWGLKDYAEAMYDGTLTKITATYELRAWVEEIVEQDPDDESHLMNLVYTYYDN